MIYFDNAATSLHKPACVARAVAQALSSLGNCGRGGHGASLDAGRMIYETRERLCALFGAEDPSRIAFTANSTQALNTAIRGVLRPGDHVVTTVLEHNSVLRPLYEMEEKGVRLTVVGCDALGRVDYAALERAVGKDTRAVVCTHGSNLTGNLVDVRRVGEIAHAKGALMIVDASQTAGVFDIDVQAMHIDMLCFTGHKGLMGPQGTGGICVRRGVDVRPLVTGGSGVKSFSRSHPAEMPTALEAGTLNGHGIAGLNAALGYIGETGLESIRSRELALMRAFYEGVREIPGVTVYGDFSAPQRCAVVALNLWDWDSSQVSDALFESYGIATRPGAHCAPLMHEALGTRVQGAVRFSFSHFNTFEEIDTALAALRELAKTEK